MGKTDDKKTNQRNFIIRKKELIKKYKYYSRELKKLYKRNNDRIPKIGTPDGNLHYRYMQAMNAIENIAKKQGFKLR